MSSTKAICIPSRPASPSEIPFSSNLDGALFWFKYGLAVIPILPASKHPALKWDPWLNRLSPETIQQHWTQHPSHELACIVGDSLFVLDADSPESEAALQAIEGKYGAAPLLTIRTKRGCHHYFRLDEGVSVKTDSHATDAFPDRIDVKTGRGMAILPPSTDKKIQHLHVNSVGQLHAANQDFIDAVFKHNGRQPPRPSISSIVATVVPEVGSVKLKQLQDLLEHISPDVGYQDWVHVLMALCHETQGSEDGLALADRWSSQGSGYKGEKEIEAKWRSFNLGQSNPLTIATLIKMAAEGGANVKAIMNKNDAEFEVCEYEEVCQGEVVPTEGVVNTGSPLTAFSLRGRLLELEKQMVEQKQILGSIVLQGQATVVYARANTGKTLILIHLIIESIKQELINPAQLYYINMDDNSSGLVDKVRLAEEYGFDMLADGHQGFEASAFRRAMESMIAENTARGVIVVLDTLKKFVNTMDKGKSSEFAKVIRQFCLKGGTVIALSHANKNPGADGRSMYSGTSDIVDDFDCAFMLNTISQQADMHQKVVEFSNIKRRGNVSQTAAYSYTLDSDIPYDELLLSVKEVNPEHLVPLKRAADIKSDSQIIEVIEDCIREGINSKMKLADAAAERARDTKRSVLKVIEKYTGNDPAIYRWSFSIQERGAKVFSLLELPSDSSDGTVLKIP
ncbi:PriCT-2 domain-containing protein [Pseudomonas sp. 65/3-MNA-CIBAN-0223]|uniref:PriCT-2 domain-containing protein n=1 Tax=Pseudomonas sp. 65/3-MNA-CIBAN-0223 TaxID=3140476 RepID=UPI0033317E72